MTGQSSPKPLPRAKERAKVNLERRSEIGREIRQKKLKMILTKTIAYLADRSFVDTRIEDIAKSSGVSPRTFYNYFAQKDDFADAIGLLLYNVASHTAERNFEDANDVIESLAYKILASGEFCIHHNEIARVSFDLYLSRYPKFRAAWDTAARSFYIDYELGVSENRFVRLEQDTLSDFILTPLYYRFNRVARAGKRTRIELLKDGAYMALTTLGVPAGKARQSIERMLPHLPGVDLEKVDQAYAKTIEQTLR